MSTRHPSDWGSLFQHFYERLTEFFPEMPTEQRWYYANLAARRWVVAVQPLLLGLPPLAAVGRALQLSPAQASDGDVLAALDAAAIMRCVARLGRDDRVRLDRALRDYEYEEGNPVSAMETELNGFSPSNVSRSSPRPLTCWPLPCASPGSPIRRPAPRGGQNVGTPRRTG